MRSTPTTAGAAARDDAPVAEEGPRYRAAGIAWVAEKRPLVRIRDRDDKVAPFRGKPEAFETFRAANAGKFRNSPIGQAADEAIVKAVNQLAVAMGAPAATAPAASQ